MLKRSGRILSRAVAVILALSGGALAHHGVTGKYDASVPIVLVGEVTATAFSPPHPVVTVRVDSGDLPDGELGRKNEYFGPPVVRQEDVGAERVVEFSPVRMFYDLEDRLKVGDRVTIVALRNCFPTHQLRSTWLRLSNGEVISYEGDWARGVNGCS
ncbi:hypothetical protein [Rhizobium bangladeshense]|uniref:hypothetical protein n=1 Tax=Rhizobium bangladeshense TaxID=1138189 RepID=UPI0009EDEFFC|nr:hypothetical protein [Rhizobium bangladeshense]